jgi:ATP-dependent Clp protease ATP-binding subunit ClpC
LFTGKACKPTRAAPKQLEPNGSYEAMRDKILDESKWVFKPEFLNRLDDMIVFHQLERKLAMELVD